MIYQGKITLPAQTSLGNWLKVRVFFSSHEAQTKDEAEYLKLSDSQ
jgi:hypothetical protein